jgi:hypothetical protein
MNNSQFKESPTIIPSLQDKYVECAWNILDVNINIIDSIGAVYQLFSEEYSRKIMDEMNCTLEEAYKAIVCYLKIKTSPTVPDWGVAREYSFDVIFENGAKRFVGNGANNEERVAITKVYNEYLDSKKLPEPY